MCKNLVYLVTKCITHLKIAFSVISTNKQIYIHIILHSPVLYIIYMFLYSPNKFKFNQSKTYNAIENIVLEITIHTEMYLILCLDLYMNSFIFYKNLL